MELQQLLFSSRILVEVTLSLVLYLKKKPKRERERVKQKRKMKSWDYLWTGYICIFSFHLQHKKIHLCHPRILFQYFKISLDVNLILSLAFSEQRRGGSSLQSSYILSKESLTSQQLQAKAWDQCTLTLIHLLPLDYFWLWYSH